jgi:hypothetical protein
MLRTNSKKAIENVKAYVVEWCKDYLVSDYGKEEKDLQTSEQVLDGVYEVFMDEYGRRDYRTRKRGGFVGFDVFKDWAQGLAMGGLFCYYYNRSAVDELGAILEESEEEKARYTEEQAEETLTRLIFREIEKAHDEVQAHLIKVCGC